VDLLFPHHENEIAQSQCCNGTTFANHWYHSEHLLVDGTTMSKSKGNYYTLSDLVEKGYSPMAVRYALLDGHPRKQLNFTLDSLHAAESALQSLRQYAKFFCAKAGVSFDTFINWCKSPQPYAGSQWAHVVRVPEILKNDLNFPGAFGELFHRLTVIKMGMLSPNLADAKEMKQLLVGMSHVLFALGLDLDSSATSKTDIPAAITALAEKRWAAKQAKDFAAADALRKELTAAGWSMLDRKDGYSLEPLKK
jgi:cysteinyl-tRNA synthetase